MGVTVGGVPTHDAIDRQIFKGAPALVLAVVKVPRVLDASPVVISMCSGIVGWFSQRELQAHVDT
jgi:hypothetical protein